jgi:hypothetical protein
MPFLNKRKKHANRRHHLSQVAGRRSTREKIAGSFRELNRATRTAVAAVRRTIRNAAARATTSDSPEGQRSLIETLISTAAAFRSVAAQLENEARQAMAGAAEIRKELPKLLEPQLETIAGTRVLIFEFGQPLTAQEAFAAALDLNVAEVTVKKIADARGFLPRAVADALEESRATFTVLLTRLRNRERRFMVWPGKRPRQVRAKRGGSLAVSDGRAETFYFQGTARLPAGTRIALPAAAIAA